MFVIGIDVGGTFTDLVAINEAGHTVFAKSPSTPQDQSIGVMAGLEELARRLGLPVSQMLAQTQRLVHGTTVATNALLERKGARVALLTTEGHRDILEMREGLKPDRYDLRRPPPEPLVPRELRFGVRERLRPNGEVSVALDQDSVGEAIAAIKQAGATSVAICFLHAYRNPAHEMAAAERLQRELPAVSLSCSSDVLPQIKEYERVSTTVVNAFIGPVLRRYLERLERRLSEACLQGRLFIVLSHGGMAPVAEAVRLAAATVLSGPAGGVSGCRRCAAMLGIPDLVAFDMGGTSTDVSLIADGRVTLSVNGGLAGERIALRSLDIASLAAGGGSIASVDRSGILRVGPESAGAMPGPAAYGNGGNAATVTDANVVLGYLDAGAFMGGKRPLDVMAAEAAIDRLAGVLKITRIEAATGVFRLVNLKMADGIRLMTVRRGVDPRRFALLSFGGAAGLHTVELARELDIARIIVPATASVLSAWGMLNSDLRYELSRTHFESGVRTTPEEVRQIFTDLEARAVERLRGWFNGPIAVELLAEMRYGEQIFEVDVPLDGIDLNSPALVKDIEERFHRRHEELYTYASRDQEVVFVNARAAAIGEICLPEPAQRAAQSTSPCIPRSRRKAYFDMWRDVDVYAFGDLEAGQTLEGPAIIEAESTTVVINKGDVLSVNKLGWLDIRVAKPRTHVSCGIESNPG